MQDHLHKEAGDAPMAVIGFSHPNYDIVAFTEQSPSASEDVLPVVVVLRGRQPERELQPARATGRLSPPWTSSWSNGVDVVQYSRTNGVVAVAEREFQQCPDGRTLVVLADARHPADAVDCIAIADLPVPRMETMGTLSVLWRMLRARVLGKERCQWPHDQWLQQLTRIPEVQAFLTNAASRTH